MCQRLSSCRSVSLCAHRTHAVSPSHTSLPWSCLHSSSKQRLHTGGRPPCKAASLLVAERIGKCLPSAPHCPGA